MHMGEFISMQYSRSLYALSYHLYRGALPLGLPRFTLASLFYSGYAYIKLRRVRRTSHWREHLFWELRPQAPRLPLARLFLYRLRLHKNSASTRTVAWRQHFVLGTLPPGRIQSTKIGGPGACPRKKNTPLANKDN